jgi:hypothetical protein
MVRWIGGPHVAAHRDTAAIFARIKPTCDSADYEQLVRGFTKGAQTLVNAYNSQENHQAYRDYGNPTSIDENTAMVDKTLLNEVARGCALMLDPGLIIIWKVSNKPRTASCNSTTPQETSSRLQ